MTDSVCISAIRKEAEELYRNHDFYCSEAIVSAIRRHVDPSMPVEAISMASGFPLGVGRSFCMCGAVSGGVVCLGYFFGRTQPKDDRVNKAMALSKELYDAFTGNHSVACCAILTKGMELGSPTHMEQCISFTGEVAAKTAEIIARELSIRTTT
jgi:C_GCAxxG_C_C family probable redox protein